MDRRGAAISLLEPVAPLNTLTLPKCGWLCHLNKKNIPKLLLDCVVLGRSPPK
jgi:hypothetical protein